MKELNLFAHSLGSYIMSSEKNAVGPKAKEILRKYNTIAVVGCSRDPEKAAYQIPKYMKEHGYKIIPVNPSDGIILGEKAYGSLLDVDIPFDIVDVFRPSTEAVEVVKQAIKKQAKAVWLQLGIVNEEAAKLAKESGLEFVMDKCIMVEHKNMPECKD
jgi:predicted CoA-binding protein